MADHHSGAKRSGVANLGQLCSQCESLSQSAVSETRNRSRRSVNCSAGRLVDSLQNARFGSLTNRNPLIPPHVHPQIGRKRIDVSVHADDRYRPLTRHRRMDAAGSLSLVDRSLALLIVPPAREGFPRSRWWW